MKKLLSAICAVVLLISCISGAFVITAGAAAPELEVGEIITSLPIRTTGKNAYVSDDTKLGEGTVELAWDELERASSYSVQVFFNIAELETGKALNFMFEQGIETDSGKVTVEGLEICRRYTIVIYALAEDGSTLAIYDRIPVFTVTPPADEDQSGSTDVGSDKAADTSTDDAFIIMIIVSVTAAVLLIAGVIITVVLVRDKRRKKD